MQRKREATLRQHVFFQLRIHLVSGQNLLAMDKNGLCEKPNIRPENHIQMNIFFLFFLRLH